MAIARCGNALFHVNTAAIVFTVWEAAMYAPLTISKTVQVLVASILVACIFVFCPLSANAASKGSGTKNVQSNSAKRGTANSPLTDAGKSGTAKGAAGGGGGTSPLKKASDTDGGIVHNIK
jgi:hypothetical protein